MTGTASQAVQRHILIIAKDGHLNIATVNIILGRTHVINL